MNITTTETEPWSCARDGARLLWRRASVDCPVCGHSVTLPSAPAEVPPMKDRP